MVSLMVEAELILPWAHIVNGAPLALLIGIRVHYGFKFTLAHAPAITARNIYGESSSAARKPAKP